MRVAVQSLQKILSSRSTTRLLIRATSPMHYQTWREVTQLTGDEARIFFKDELQMHERRMHSSTVVTDHICTTECRCSALPRRP
ncbi:hypothetical protein Y032_0011g1339 [Ancylostoma ceylanicum]|uniref:Uncharacterized protein n=1 Tax=Ancylostoma ceylanicum TaxID=53326 RepID=A0A016VEI3_9BILA|nr:hypothetical protein Y032_0011g1339 [Ancylostoma ceylanicum]